MTSVMEKQFSRFVLSVLISVICMCCVFQNNVRAGTVSASCDHRYGEWTVTRNPTCTEEGSRKRVCELCQDVDTEVIEAAGHDWEDDYTVDEEAWSCMMPGSKSIHCKNCDARKDVTEIPAPVHPLETSVRKATLTRNGTIVTGCRKCGNWGAPRTIYRPAVISLAETVFTYTGKVQKPKVTVKDLAGRVIGASNYTLYYYGSCKDIGSYRVKITFKGNYSGSVKKTFSIVPRTTSLSGLSAVSSGFSAAWKKQTAQTSGYQIQYAESRKFSGAKTVTISGNRVVTKKITGLTGNRKYYVRIRTYKIVENKKICSAWSDAKTVKTKK